MTSRFPHTSSSIPSASTSTNLVPTLTTSNNATLSSCATPSRPTHVVANTNTQSASEITLRACSLDL
eukprot:CAMPEP_0185858200 /NCGR_PEP_ID=MMETSP1354-20130828/29894_1 /TAXON_ID=708628 /ORGANISM="Erythrolobus madagascarensis, Strain CCMP3276" /LENGTH=66 /DNA_ID=CAMNT_0028560481 /DNA_START=802 /DNA_END=1002 /DNA_ORIENTATION=+